MNDYSKDQLEASRPAKSASACIDHCLSCLYADKNHCTTDLVAQELTYEEVIGALLLGRDAIKQQEEK
jgi:hypothetical protein